MDPLDGVTNVDAANLFRIPFSVLLTMLQNLLSAWLQRLDSSLIVMRDSTKFLHNECHEERFGSMLPSRYPSDDEGVDDVNI